MDIPNLIGVMGLSGVIIKLTKEFFSKQYVEEEKK
jgi:AGCS family alanine or glycine:cation symporter